jgi:hypothetical protein
MSEHLPECLVPDFERGFWVCICKNLRACEERVRGEEQQRIETALTFVGQHDAAWELAVRDKALRDAREAVEAVNWFNDEGKMLSAIVATAESIAAIDALRGEKR